MEKTVMGVGVVGCGNISPVYFTNLTQHYTNVKVLACADLIHERALEAKEKFGIPKACSVDELLADPKIELVVNLTNPASHFEVSKKALEAGKHVYSEKSMALSLEDANTLYDLAAEKGLRIASAPDTYLGGGLQTCRKLVDEGAIGTPCGFTANLTCAGHELWHPEAGFHLEKNGGPMLDMGPYYVAGLVSIFGPVKQIFCFCKTPRKVRSVNGEPKDVEAITHYTGVMEFENGATGTITQTFDAWNSELPCLEIWGTEGSIVAPDPNFFCGPVKLFSGKGLVEKLSTIDFFVDKLMTVMGPARNEFLTEVPLILPVDESPNANMRGLGVSEMASAIMKGRKPRLEAEFARHVVEALTGFAISGQTGQVYKMTTTCERPRPMATGLELWQVD